MPLGFSYSLIQGRSDSAWCLAGINLTVSENRGVWLSIETPAPEERRGWILKEWIQE